MVRRIGVALALAGCLPLAGCGLLRTIGLLPSPPPAPAPVSETPAPPADYLLALTIEADADINPDPRGRASPLRVHVYADERDPRLGELGFESVFGAGPGGTADASGERSTPLETLTLPPGERLELALTPPTTAGWISVAAAYREPWSAVWVATLRLSDTLGAATARARLERAAVRLDEGREP